MSRLKGADLGISVPGAPLNYRGDWSASPAPAYAVNDLVVRSGGAYVAALLPGANDPIGTGVITQASSSSMGTGSVVGAQSTIQFSVPADTWVSALDIGMARAHAGGSKAGIASVFGAGTSVIPYLVSGLTTATAGAGASRVVLSAPILLKAGTTYNLVCEATDVAATTANGGLVTGYSILSNLLWGASFSGGSWGNFLPFNLLMTPWRALVPSGALNFRGAWVPSPVPPYAANDVVLRNGSLYRATDAPSQTADPLGAASSFTQIGAQSSSTDQFTSIAGGLSPYTKIAQPFQVSALTTVTAVQLYYGYRNGGQNSTGGQTVGIAAALGATVNYLGKGQSQLVGAGTNTGGSGTFDAIAPLDAPVTLQPGVTYYLVSEEQAAGATNTPSLSGSITLPAGAIVQNATYPNFNGQATAKLPFALYTSPWAPIGGPGPGGSYRGTWRSPSLRPYVAGDVVTRNGASYLALGAAGSADPATGMVNLGAQTAFAGGPSGTTQIAQAFTVSQPTVVTQVKYKAASTGGTGGGQSVGIASAVGSTVSWISQGTSHAVAAGAYDTVVLPDPAALQPGVTYYLICNETNSDGSTVPVATGMVTVGAFLFGANYASSSASYRLCFELDGSPWTPLAAPTLLNYRGAWTASPSVPYAANDTVSDAGLLWLALAGVPNGQAKPSLTPMFAGSSVGAATAGGLSANGAASMAQPFTTSAAGGSVGSISITFSAAAAAATIKVGIATAIGAGDLNVTWLGATPASVAAPGAAGTYTYTLPATLTLAGSTTYYVVVQVQSAGGGTTNVGWTASALTVSGIVASTGQLSRTPFTGNNWTTSTNNMPFTLSGTQPYWQSLSPTADVVNTVAASGAAVTLPDVTVATMHRVTLTAAATITLPTPGLGKRIRVSTQQDATGARTLAWATPSGAIRWPGGTVPTVSAGANAIDVVEFYCVDGTNWFGHDLGRALA